MTQVRLIVDPLSIYKSGAPIISVDGSVRYEKFFCFWYSIFCLHTAPTPSLLCIANFWLK